MKGRNVVKIIHVRHDGGVTSTSGSLSAAAPSTRRERLREATLREMCADGMAVVFVTHDEAQADRVARRRLQLGDGRLTESGVAPPGRPAARDA